MDMSPAPSSRVQIIPATAAEFDRVNEVLIAEYAAGNGTLDRSREPLPCPARDSRERPVQFFLAHRDGSDRGAAGVTEGGDVVDWAVLPGAAASDVARALLGAVETWARSRGAAELNLFVAGRDSDSIRALSSGGFFESAPPITVMQVVHFPGFLAAILANRDATRFPARSLHVELEPGLYPDLPDPRFTVRVRGEAFVVESGAVENADLTVRATATDFSGFLLGGMSPLRFARRCRIRPLHRWGAALGVLRCLAPERGWYTPLGERR